MAGQGRSVESWNALAPSTRRRWRAAYGSPDAALEAYRNGASLTSAQRGHAFTPERPVNALFAPWKYPKYVATHTSQLNQIARARGLAEHGTGPRGETDETKSYYKSGGDFTWVVPRGTVSNLPEQDRHFGQTFRTQPEAQLYARRSWAPAGVVLIEDNRWEGGTERPPDTTDSFRYEVWFLYPEPLKKKVKKKTKKR